MSRARRKGPHIYRRPGRPGLWGYVDRTHRDIPLHTDDERAAFVELAQHVERHRSRDVRAPARAGSLGPIFAETERRALVENTAKTAYEIGRNLHRIACWCLERGVECASEVDAQLVADFKESRRASKSRRTGEAVTAARINREIDSWKRAMRIAVERRDALPEVLELFTHLREATAAPKRRSRSRAELERFLRAVSDRTLRAFLRVVLGTGLRDEEVRHLRRAWITSTAITVSPMTAGACPCHPAGWTTKSFRYREIPISPRTRAAAYQLVTALEAKWTIPSARWVWEQMKRACAAARVPRFSLHELRHAGASHWLASGIDIATISRWLGHRDVLTTQRYLHVVTDERANRRRLPW